MTSKQLNEFGYLSRDATTTDAGDELLLPHNPELFIATNAILDSEFTQDQLFIYMDVNGSMENSETGGNSGIEAMQQSAQALTQSAPVGMLVIVWDRKNEEAPNRLGRDEALAELDSNESE